MTSRVITGRDPQNGNPLAITVQDGRIHSILPGSAKETAWLSAGFIDLQINGFAGIDLNSDAADAEAVLALTSRMIALGVTTYLPTIITSSEAHIIAALRMIAEARRISPLVAHVIPYVHVEGPFIAAEDGPRGAHSREHVRPASLDEFERWQMASGDLVGMLTISPHTDAALNLISTIAGKGIAIAVGHSHASTAQIHAAADAGARLSTHLGNGIGNLLPRHPNPLWAQLAEDRLSATFIADGQHLPADTLKTMLRAKGVERSILISDAVALGGMPPGIYETAIGGFVEVTAEHKIASASGGTFLAGGYLPLPDCVAHVAGLGEFSLGDAVTMATKNPGRFVGDRGCLRVGAAADLVRFQWKPGDTNLQIETVWVEGAEVA